MRKPRRSTFRSIALLIWLLACTYGLVQPGPAFAHASLLHSSPSDGAVLAAPPSSLRLWFSEPIDLPYHALEVQEPDGKRAPLGQVGIGATNDGEMVAAFRGRQNGTYVVSWKVISADSHPVWGSFTFSIGAPSAVLPVTAGASPGYTRIAVSLQALGRWLNLLGATLVVGPFVAWWWVLGEVAARTAQTQRRRAWRRSAQLAGTGSILVLLGAGVAVVAQMAALADGWREALSFSSLGEVFIGQLGYILTLRAGAAVAAWILCSVLLYLPAPDPAKPQNLPPLARLLIALGALVLLSASFVGHAATTSPVLLSLLLDWIHLGAMAVWVGGMLALARALPPLLDREGAPELETRWATLGTVIPRFSRLAVLCLLALTVSGLYSALRNVSDLGQLATTDYGRALSIKLGLLIVVMAIAAINLLALGPAVRRVAAGATPRVADLWPLFRPLLRVEAALLVLILAAVGFLTALEPARQAAETPAASGYQAPLTVQSVVDSGTHSVLAWHVGGTLVTLALAPSATGSATLAVALDGPENNGVAGAVTVSFTPLPGSGMQAVLATLAPQGQGEYGATLPLSDRGTWAIGVDVALRNDQRGRFNASVTLPLQAAQSLLARTDQVTNRLYSMVMQQMVTAGQPPVRTRWEFQAPDRMHYLAVGDIETYRVGTKRWDRHVGGRWQSSDLTPQEAFRWPDSRYAQEGWDAVVIGHEKVAGQSCAVVTFWDAYPNATFRLWIDQRSGRTLRLELLRPGGFEYDDFTDFNAGPRVIPPGR